MSFMDRVPRKPRTPRFEVNPAANPNPPPLAVEPPNPPPLAVELPNPNDPNPPPLIVELPNPEEPNPPPLLVEPKVRHKGVRSSISFQ